MLPSNTGNAIWMLSAIGLETREDMVSIETRVRYAVIEAVDKYQLGIMSKDKGSLRGDHAFWLTRQELETLVTQAQSILDLAQAKEDTNA